MEDKVTVFGDGVGLRKDRTSSSMITPIPRGSQLQLGNVEIVNGCEWMEVTLDDGTTGHCMEVQIRSQTTLGSQFSAASMSLGVPAPNDPEAGSATINPRDGECYIWIPPGTFKMGEWNPDKGTFEDELPAHIVTITRGFWMGRTPVTSGAFNQVTSPEIFKKVRIKNGIKDYPVRYITWDEATQYASIIGMRLPTEAEWEWAARGGKGLGFYIGKSPSLKVGRMQPNGYGLHDMLGNVFQWVSDRYGPYQPAHQTDPQGPCSGDSRVLRGGFRISGGARSSTRYKSAPDAREEDLGFRCVAETL